MLAGHHVAFSMWTPFVLVWQDVLVALVFAGVVRLVRQPALTWSVYSLAAAWVALNTPIARELSSPLTPAMLRGAGGALSDSILSRLTPANVASVVAVVAAAACAPWVVRRARSPRATWLVLAGIVCVLVGAVTTSRVETLGRHRNAMTTLLPPAAVAALTRPA